MTACWSPSTAASDRYQRHRRDRARLGGATRRRRWERFACLDEQQARELAEHVVGHARIGRDATLYAIADFIAETHEAALGSLQPAGPTVSAPRPRLRVIGGGAS
ncbi:MAG: hypothetical protein ACLP50_33505 [Solirubrobacteraceae bacterium]